jgi:hypothetical protein
MPRSNNKQQAGSTNKDVEAVTDARRTLGKPHWYRSSPFHCAHRGRRCTTRDLFAVGVPARFFAGIIVSQEEYA